MIERINNNEELVSIYGGKKMNSGQKKAVQCSAGIIGGYLAGWGAGPIGATVGAVAGGINCLAIGLKQP